MSRFNIVLTFSHFQNFLDIFKKYSYNVVNIVTCSLRSIHLELYSDVNDFSQTYRESSSCCPGQQ